MLLWTCTITYILQSLLWLTQHDLKNSAKVKHNTSVIKWQPINEMKSEPCCYFNNNNTNNNNNSNNISNSLFRGAKVKIDMDCPNAFHFFLFWVFRVWLSQTREREGKQLASKFQGMIPFHHLHQIYKSNWTCISWLCNKRLPILHLCNRNLILFGYTEVPSLFLFLFFCRAK